MEDRKFIPTVSTGLIIDQNTDELLGIFESATDFGISGAMDSFEIRGGENHQLLFEHYFGRTITLDITSATFMPEVLALQAGDSFSSTTNDMYTKETGLTLDGTGEVTLGNTPTTTMKVALYNPAVNTRVNVTPSGDTVTYAPWADATNIQAVYLTSKTVEKLEIAKLNPTAVKLIMHVHSFRKSGGGVSQNIQLTVPNLQVSGEFEFMTNSSSPLETTLSGKAIFDDTSGTYFDMSIEDVDGSVAPTTGISGEFVSTSSNYLDVASPGTNTDYDVVVYAERSSTYGRKDVTTDCTFAMSAGSDADITVGATTGIVTIASTSIAGDVGIVEISYTENGIDFETTLSIEITA